MEQLHKIFKLCGSPSEEYWKKSKLPHATIFKPQQSYKRCIAETFKDFPASSLPLIETLLAIDPAERQTATAALRSEVSIYIQLSDCYAPNQALVFCLQYGSIWLHSLFYLSISNHDDSLIVLLGFMLGPFNEQKKEKKISIWKI